MAARTPTTTAQSTVLTFAQKREALKALAPQVAKTSSGLRDKAVGVLGGSFSKVLSFGSDIKTEFKYQEAVRKGQV